MRSFLPWYPEPARAEQIAELSRFSRDNPRYYGIHFQAVNLLGNPRAQLREAVVVAARRMLWRAAPLHRETTFQADVLCDARAAGKHEAIWLPVVRELSARGLDVGLLHEGHGIPEDARQVLVAERSPAVRPEMQFGAPRKALGRVRLPRIRARVSLPYGGIYGVALTQLASMTDDYTEAWICHLRDTPVKRVISTNPVYPWAASLFVACRELGIETVFLQQGFPSWYCPFCSTALVWTELGARQIRKVGWPDTRVIVARNPSIPTPGGMARMRAIRRAELALPPESFCVLFLGQKSSDQTIRVEGYVETCALLRDGMRRACGKDERLVPLLRPHYGERDRETETILRSKGGLPLRVSQGTELMEDVAAADLVISMHSTALEEAWLAGLPIVQVVAENVEPALDFGCLGAPLARTPDGLAELLRDRSWIEARIESPGRPTVAEALLGEAEMAEARGREFSAPEGGPR